MNECRDGRGGREPPVRAAEACAARAGRSDAPHPVLLPLLLILAAALAAAAPQRAAAQEFDLVVLGGRVMDPESGLDAVRDVGIRDGRIAAVRAGGLTGRDTLDARGLVVAPGFIDLHAHGQTPENHAFQALDGVTTALEMEIGVADVDAWYAERADGRRIHFGATVGHVPVRMAVMGDPGTFLPSGAGGQQRADEATLARIVERVEQGLREGALGVGFGISYTPAADHWEVLELFRVAARFDVPAFVHLRGGGMQGLSEAIAASAVTGAPLHLVHLNSAAQAQTGRWLRVIEEARASGLDVTTEAYPYTAGSTSIESAPFDAWESWPDERFERYEWVATGERLTRESFGRYREQGGPIIIHSNTEEMVELALASPLTAIASDGLMIDGRGHPRGTSTYSRVLGRYVRERGTLSLMEALRKMTLLPAQRLEARVPAMRDKGRIRVGADADLTLFDADRVIDRATYQEPALQPEGILHVVVAGVPVVRDARLVEGVTPGRAVRAPRTDEAPGG